MKTIDNFFPLENKFILCNICISAAVRSSIFRSKFEAIPDDLTPDEVLEQTRKAAQKVRQRLDLKKVNTKVIQDTSKNALNSAFLDLLMNSH